MSAYRGRTGPNFSEFLHNLNSVSPYDEQSFSAEALDESDLSMFTNTDFTSLDMNITEDTGFNYPLNHEHGEIKYQDLLGVDAQPFNPGSLNTSPADTPQYYPGYTTPIQPAPSTFPVGINSLRSGNESQPAPSHSKVDSSESRSIVSPDDSSRHVAEEDKRRRNTAASARFRVKKKQREAALERSVREVNEINSKLQARLDQLDMENKWLKDLITEKNGTIQSKEDIDQAFQRFKRESEEAEERQDVRSEAARVKGVGTQ